MALMCEEERDFFMNNVELAEQEIADLRDFIDQQCQDIDKLKAELIEKEEQDEDEERC